LSLDHAHFHTREEAAGKGTGTHLQLSEDLEQTRIGEARARSEGISKLVAKLNSAETESSTHNNVFASRPNTKNQRMNHYYTKMAENNGKQSNRTLSPLRRRRKKDKVNYRREESGDTME
jgi:hypothetical protein